MSPFFSYLFVEDKDFASILTTAAEGAGDKSNDSKKCGLLLFLIFGLTPVRIII
jgi:hypothetical protein